MDAPDLTRTRTPQRIALFGGSFDPPHRGHLAVARAAADAFHLDRVLLAPSGRQPLKPDGAVAAYADRLAMVGVACAVDARLEASSIDAPLVDGSSNFTVTTLATLERMCPGARLFNLVGADSFRDLARWKDPGQLLDVVDWIVVSRPGYTLTDPAGLTLSREQRRRIHLLESVQEDVDATGLRERLRLGEACGSLLPEGVEAYIRCRGLYGSELSARSTPIADGPKPLP